MIKLFSRLSLTNRVLILTSFWALLILTSVISYSYYASKKMLTNEIYARNIQLAETIAGRIESEIQWIERSIQRTSKHILSRPITRQNVVDIFGDALDNQRNTLGGVMIFTKEATIKREYNAIHFFRKKLNESYIFSDRNSPLDYTEDWYTIPYYMKRPYWTEPYVDFDENAVMVSYSYPIFRSDSSKLTHAILRADISTDWIHELISKEKIHGKCDIRIMSPQGLYISHPNPEYIMKEGFFSLIEGDSEQVHQYIQAGYQILGSDSGIVTNLRPTDPLDKIIFYTTVPSCGWKIGIILEEKVAMAEIDTMLKISIVLGILGFIFFLLASVKLAAIFARPISVLSEIADVVATGKFDIKIPKFDSCREMENLASSFNKMIQDLRKHIAYLTIATSQKEKISSELAIARDIQMDLVPKLRPPYPINAQADLYAKLIPALEVGGDFYDFAFIDQDTLYIAIGDVSGKGIGAALMMAVTRTHIRSAIMNLRDPAKALYVTNNEIAANNDACMFVTLFIAVIKLKTGKVTYSNAGHNPPLIFRNETNQPEWLSAHPRPPIGPFKDIDYQNEETYLDIGDSILLYTDGITEAMSPRSEMYSEERLAHFMSKNHNIPSPAFLDMLYDDINYFSKGVAQYDDMTTLLLKIHTTKRTTMPLKTPPFLESLTLSKELTDLNRLVAWLETLSEKYELPMSVAMKLNLVLEEWFVNVISYAFPDGELHHIIMTFALDGDKIYIQIIDDGIPYDPTAEVNNEHHKPLEERRIGGLGIHFIKESMDLFHYARHEGKNINTLMTSISNSQ